MTRLQGLAVAGVPVLLGTPVNAPPPLPTVLWFHGFRADALAHAAELERCVNAGFLVVGIDAVGHGARRDESLQSQIANAGGNVMLIMQAQISATIAEVPTLVDALVTDYNADPARISVVGVSMGAFLVYRLLLTALPIRSAVALLGAPDDLPSAELVHAAQRVTLLSITAEHDVNVPPHETVALHKALGVQAQHHVLRGSGHLTSAEHWHEAMQHTERWLDDHAR